MATEEGKKEVVKEEAPIFTKAQHQEQLRQQQEQRKQMEREFADYKKRLTKGNELKRLQVDEIVLNIQYHKAKKEYMELAPEIEKLEAEEAKLLAKENEKREKAMKEMKEKMEKQKKKDEKEKAPLIIVPKTGTARK